MQPTNKSFVSPPRAARPPAHLVQLDEGVTWAADALSQVGVSEAAPHSVAVRVLGGQVEVVWAVHTGPDQSRTTKTATTTRTHTLIRFSDLSYASSQRNKNYVLFLFFAHNLRHTSKVNPHVVWGHLLFD